MGLGDRATTAGRTVSRLGFRDGAELTTIASIVRRADDNRRVRYAVAVGFVSAAVGPPRLTLAYLSTNATQVNVNLSMFCHHCLGIHLTVAGVVALGALLFPRPRYSAAARGPRSTHALPAVLVEARAWQPPEAGADGSSRSIHGAVPQRLPRTCWRRLAGS